MRTTLFCFVFTIIASFLLLRTSLAQQQRTVASGWLRADEIAQQVNLSPFSPDSVYSISLGTDSPLRIRARAHTESPIMPVYIGFETVAQRHAERMSNRSHSPRTSNQGRFYSHNQEKLEAATIYYSALFIDSDLNYDFDWRVNMTKSSFEDLVTEFDRDRGLRLESFDIYPTTSNTSSRYAATWTDDYFLWQAALDLPLSDFVNAHQALFAQGYRMADFEYDTRTGGYGGLWIDDGLGSFVAFGFSSSELAAVMAFYLENNGIPVDLRIHSLNTANTSIAYNAAVAENFDEYEWAVAWDLSANEFNAVFQQTREAGFRMTDYEIYQIGQDIRFAGIWVDDFTIWDYLLNIDDRPEFEDEIDYFITNYEVRPVNFEMITGELRLAVEGEPAQIESYALAQNYPNPFNPQTGIKFVLPENAFVTLKVYDLLGKEVATLVDGKRAAGSHEVSFNAGHLASGLYLYRLEARGKSTYTEARKMNLMK